MIYFDNNLNLRAKKCGHCKTPTPDVIKLNHYTNFQPLFWRDNIIKGDKLDWQKGDAA